MGTNPTGTGCKLTASEFEARMTAAELWGKYQVAVNALPPRGKKQAKLKLQEKWERVLGAGGSVVAAEGVKTGNGVTLVDAAIWAGRPAVSFLDELGWVKDNLALADVGPADAPSSGAWMMLCEARGSAVGKKTFLDRLQRAMLSRTILGAGEAEAESKVEMARAAADLAGMTELAIRAQVEAEAEAAKVRREAGLDDGREQRAA